MGYDAANTGQIVDTMALAFNRSALDLSRFRESIKYIAPLARSVGFSIEDVSAILSKLSDAGINGSMAGTSLRNIFMSLADESSDLSKRIGGATKSFDDFITSMEMLNDAGIGAGEMFGLIDRRAVTALNTIKDNASAIRELSIDMENANGAVDEMANIQMESLANKIKIATNAMDAFILSLDRGDGFLSSTIKNSLATFTDGLNNITENLKSQSKAIEDELSELDSLGRIILQTNESYSKKLLMLDELRRRYPEYLKNISDESILTDEFRQVFFKLRNELSNPLPFISTSEELEKSTAALARANEDLAKMTILAMN
jgi:hypothetical protein